MATVLELEKLQLAAKGGPLPEGWEHLDERNTESGYHGVAYYKAITGEIVTTHQGTDPKDVRDLTSDFLLALSIAIKQADDGYNFSKDIRDRYGALDADGKDFQNGTSLGGFIGLSVVVRAKSDLNIDLSGFTQNAPGVAQGQFDPNVVYDIVNTRAQGDIVSLYGAHPGGNLITIPAGPDLTDYILNTSKGAVPLGLPGFLAAFGETFLEAHFIETTEAYHASHVTGDLTPAQIASLSTQQRNLLDSIPLQLLTPEVLNDLSTYTVSQLNNLGETLGIPELEPVVVTATRLNNTFTYIDANDVVVTLTDDNRGTTFYTWTDPVNGSSASGQYNVDGSYSVTIINSDGSRVSESRSRDGLYSRELRNADGFLKSSGVGSVTQDAVGTIQVDVIDQAYDVQGNLASTAETSRVGNSPVIQKVDLSIGGGPASITFEYNEAGEPFVSKVTGINGTAPTTQAGLVEALNAAGITPSSLVDGPPSAGALGVLGAYDATNPANNPSVPVDNSLADFSTTVPGGPVQSTAGNDFQNGFAAIDPSFTLRVNQALLNGDGLFNVLPSGLVTEFFRPGAEEQAAFNPHSVLNVFDPTLFGSQYSANPFSSFGALLQTSLAGNLYGGASFLLNIDPLVLDLNGDGITLTDYQSQLAGQSRVPDAAGHIAAGRHKRA